MSEPRTEAGKRLLADPDDHGVEDYRAFIRAIEDEAAQLDVERLYRGMVALDDDEPGIFNIVAISDPDTRPVAETLAAEYDRLTSEAT